MIIVRVKGGLGNQLFQFSFGYAMSKTTKQEVAFDFSFYENQPGNVGKRDIELFKLNTGAIRKYNPSLLVKILNNRYIGAIARKFSNFNIKIGKDFYYFKEPEHCYVSKFPYTVDTYYDGYWQTSKYFEKYKKELQMLFVPDERIREELSEVVFNVLSENSVSVHLRKGDFGNSGIRKIGHVLPQEYYVNAIKYIRDNVTNPTFYIFTDDENWAKEILGKDYKYIYASTLYVSDSITDLYIMSKCKHGIMSASTFSWWGNWLKESRGIVIAPQGRMYNEFFFDEDWIRL